MRWIVLVFCSLIIALLYSSGLKSIQIWSWRKRLKLNQHEAVFQTLFVLVDGFALSRVARLKQDAFEYVYGEIDFTSFVALLSLTKPDDKTVFYDLGSGVGKAVIACAMVFRVQKSIGFEWFESLHQSACEQQKRLSDMPSYSFISETVQFFHADFLTKNIQDATLIFINATAFFGETWVNITRYLEQNAAENSLVISTSKALKSTFFSTIQTVTVQMSWGCVAAYIQKRKLSGIA